MVECVKKHIITIVAISLIVVAAIITVVVVLTTKGSDFDNSSSNEPEQTEPLLVLVKDEQFKKPNVKMNAEFEMVKLKNGMTGIIVSDPYATKSLFQFTMKYGFYIDTVPGISHFGEHMIHQGSEKYDSIYPLFDNFFSMKGVSLDSVIEGNYQVYYITLPFNFKYEKAIDMYTDAFRYPLYKAERIKNEIQAVNHEFYARFYSSLHVEVIRQLSSTKTPFNGMSCGNNQTLKPEESELLSKKLKGYHMVIKNPKNIFFTLYSNKTIKESEQLAERYLNYEMHQFKNDEIDADDKKKLEDNIKKLESIEIFDDTLYKHGVFYNTLENMDILIIYYYLGKFDHKNLKIDIIDYISYLFNSKSLLYILRSKNYIAVEDQLSVGRSTAIDNNHYFALEIPITEEGLKNINDILLIINKYVEIMKKEGSKKDLYINFINFANNKEIFYFNKSKSKFSLYKLYLIMFMNYLFFDKEKILLSGTFTEENYNENLLKDYLNLIKFEKSFYLVNSKKKISELNYLDSIIDSKEVKKLKYYMVNIIYGKIPDKVGQDINNKTLTIENLSIREINPYFSEKYGETVIPCYKEEKNKCVEKNEFDLENDEEYNGTKFEESEIYETYYQIDKSSESHLVYSYMQFYIDEFQMDELIIQLERYYLKNKFLDISDFLDYDFERNIMQFNIKFTTFSDNTEKIIKKFIDLLIEEPKQDDLDYSKILLKYEIYKSQKIEYINYINNIFNQFLYGRESSGNIEPIIEQINNINLESFQSFHNNILKNIYSISTKIAGNTDVNSIKNIHNYLKEKIKVKKKITLKKPLLADTSSVINYYQKSTYESYENGILVVFRVSSNYAPYFPLFTSCFFSIAFKYLRFNKTNVYTPGCNYHDPFFFIFEQGLYKEVDEMQDDINSILSDLLNGKIDEEYYKDIEESFQLEVQTIREKNFENLFDDFKSKSFSNSFNTLSKTDFPDTFAELVQLVAPVFIDPQRIDILIARKDLSDQDFNLMFERRSQIGNYTLNDNIPMVHTTDINYLR